MCLLLWDDALVSDFPGHKCLSANGSQELCPFNQHLCNTKINLFSVWQCCSGGTGSLIQDPTLVAPDLRSTGGPVCYNLGTPEETNA